MSETEHNNEGLTFSDLIDTAAVRDMMEDFHAATGFVVGIVDRGGEIVMQVGYRDICTRFHRACPETEKRCIESDVHINSSLESGSYIHYTCANGLIDAASPIVIDGEHLATIYTGQFFFDPPDEDFFDSQAERFGFDKQAYRDALLQVPVVSRSQYESVMSFLTSFGELVAQLGLQAKKRWRNEAALRQADKMEAVGRLAGGVAHDLNNMLQVILGHCDVAQFRLERGVDARRSLGEITEAANRAKAMVAQLLTFGRKSESNRALVDLGSIVQDLMNLAQRLIGEHIRVDLELDEVPPVDADSGQLEQVIMNLCVNARDAMPDGGRIRVRLTTQPMDPEIQRQHPGVAAPAGLVVLEVTDSGVGIPTEHMETIFEPFFTTKEPGQGTGLGLATVYAVAERHGGFVEVSSQIGVGTSFRISLPAGTGEVVETEPALPAQPTWVGGAETILLAEDDRLVREFTRHTLATAGYRVLEAVDGAEAVDRFESHLDEIDILVLDVIMPLMNGREVYETVRRRRPKIPVLFCSAYTQDLLENDYTLELPAGHLLQKPFTPHALLFHVRRLLDEGSEQPIDERSTQPD